MRGTGITPSCTPHHFCLPDFFADPFHWWGHEAQIGDSTDSTPMWVLAPGLSGPEQENNQELGAEEEEGEEEKDRKKRGREREEGRRRRRVALAGGSAGLWGNIPCGTPPPCPVPLQPPLLAPACPWTRPRVLCSFSWEKELAGHLFAPTSQEG